MNDYKCNINNVDYYVHDQVIFFLGNDGREYLYTEYFVYQQKETKDGWTITSHRNKFESIYVTIFRWIDEGEHPTAGKITCQAVDEFPEGFKTFMGTHAILFKQIKEDFKELE